MVILSKEYEKEDEAIISPDGVDWVKDNQGLYYSNKFNLSVNDPERFYEIAKEIKEV